MENGDIVGGCDVSMPNLAPGQVVGELWIWDAKTRAENNKVHHPGQARKSTRWDRIQRQEIGWKPPVPSTGIRLTFGHKK